MCAPLLNVLTMSPLQYMKICRCARCLLGALTLNTMNLCSWKRTHFFARSSVFVCSVSCTSKPVNGMHVALEATCSNTNSAYSHWEWNLHKAWESKLVYCLQVSSPQLSWLIDFTYVWALLEDGACIALHTCQSPHRWHSNVGVIYTE